MNQLTAFIRKEIMELNRTGKLLILVIIFAFFGIMSPAIAKLTPWMMEIFAESLADAGMSIDAVEVNAMTSWMQFYKNVPIAMIIFVLMVSGTLTAEYQKGTLVNMLTKGLRRWKVIAAKGLTLAALWTVCYWLCYGITYGYNSYFWDNGAVHNLFVGPFGVYLIGIMIISMILTLSAFMKTSSSVLAGMGGILAAGYAVSMIPLVGKYSPAQLMSQSVLLSQEGISWEYTAAIVVTVLMSIVLLAWAVAGFNRKVI